MADDDLDREIGPDAPVPFTQQPAFPQGPQAFPSGPTAYSGPRSGFSEMVGRKRPADYSVDPGMELPSDSLTADRMPGARLQDPYVNVGNARKTRDT